MLRKTIVIAVMISLCFLLAACKKESEPTAGQAAEEVEVKSSAEYEAEAEKEISTANMDAELEAIEKAMEADIQQEQTP